MTFTIYSFIIGILMASGLAFGFLMFMNNQGAEYSATIEPQYQSVFQEYNQTYQIIQENNAIVEEGAFNPEGFDAGLFSSTVAGYKQVRSAGKLGINGVYQISNVIAVRVEVLAIIALCIFVLIGGAFLSAFFKWRL